MFVDIFDVSYQGFLTNRKEIRELRGSLFVFLHIRSVSMKNLIDPNHNAVHESDSLPGNAASHIDPSFDHASLAVFGRDA
ncbi:hypothetical protein GCM10007362_10670 [Saccharibacillus endophyticus]|uniref:Uncharacterized protein n=1 Tax=Saccharibacillus endophyticus TaxID=2060666 RepID=A0ABQ1ZRG1_9BACL|nr:hypothetical protein GCM10007362_10670 [Saccharibacillus endophyticus]